MDCFKKSCFGTIMFGLGLNGDKATVTQVEDNGDNNVSMCIEGVCDTCGTKYNAIVCGEVLLED